MALVSTLLFLPLPRSTRFIFPAILWQLSGSYGFPHLYVSVEAVSSSEGGSASAALLEAFPQGNGVVIIMVERVSELALLWGW